MSGNLSYLENKNVQSTIFNLIHFSEGKYYDVVEKSIDCKSLFSNPHMDESADTEKPSYVAPMIKDLPQSIKVTQSQVCFNNKIEKLNVF